MDEQIIINQPFCIKYEIDAQDGVILSILNNSISSLDVDDILTLTPFFFKKRDTLQRRLNLLERKSLISYQSKTDKEVYDLLKNGNFDDNGCHFCGINDVVFHQHHYPIRKKENGIETITLCPNCHMKFHKLADYEKKYKFAKEYQILWNMSEKEWYEKNL